jgi:protein phosphatase
MAPKHLLPTPEETEGLKHLPFATAFPKHKRSVSAKHKDAAAHALVREGSEIPSHVIEFFKMDPRTQHPFAEEEKLFYAQVFMHEIDEGTRLLIKSNRIKEAKIIRDFSNGMHLSHRLDLLRNLLEETNFLNLKPDRVHNCHKIRNNQWGAIKARMGHHPVIAVTEPGVGYKSRNEDAFLVMPELKVLALADGMGGHAAGNVASCIAVDFFEYGVKHGMEIERAIAFSNEAILTRSKADPKLGGMHPMGCTFAAVRIDGSSLQVAHVGDTKILVLRKGKILFQTQDHTQGQQLLSEGLIDSMTAFELNHILNRCLGLDNMQAQRDVESETVALETGDRVLLLTDGITDNFFDDKFQLDRLAEISCQGSLSQAADLLIDTSRTWMASETLPHGRPSKPDNISLVMLEYRP